jgi:hypothetical protein
MVSGACHAGALDELTCMEDGKSSSHILNWLGCLGLPNANSLPSVTTSYVWCIKDKKFRKHAVAIAVLHGFIT